MTDQALAIYVGIDVSKGRLDVSVGEKGDFWSVPNDEKGIDQLVQRMKAVQPVLIVVESTGGLEVAAMTELYAASLPVALVNPGRVREFAKALGLLAKSDKLDANLLRRFGEAAKPSVTRMPDEQEQHLAGLVTRRHQLLEIRVMEENRLRVLALRPLALRPLEARRSSSKLGDSCRKKSFASLYGDS